MARRQEKPSNGAAPWRQGEHVAIVGETGSGKTYLVSKLVELRSHTVFIRTKDDDIRFPGFRKARKAEGMDNVHVERLILDPEYHRQTFELWHVFERAWKQGGWCVAIDELWYVEKLGLRNMVDRLWTQGRSKGITVMAGMQRPSQVSRFALSQAMHVFVFRTEGRDTKIVADSTTPRIVEPINSLSGYDFIYYNRRTRVVQRGNARALASIFVPKKPRQTP